MKKIIYIPAVFLLFGSISCKKYLDLQPKDFTAPEQFYKNETELNAALAGVYQALAVDATFGRNLVLELASENDETYYKRNALTVSPMLFNYDASNAIVTAVWRALFLGVNRANYLLASIDKPVMDETARNKIKGEALFLRAFMYFQLVSNWGDVPLLLTPTTDGEKINIPRTSQKEVYDQILKDMIAAKGWVSDINSIRSNARITKTAVEGILARVCLKMAGWPLYDRSKLNDARAWADSVIQSGAHSLNPDYAQVFINHSADLYDIKECIWEIEFSGNNSGDSKATASRFANQLTIRNTNPLVGYGYAIVGATGKIYSLYNNAGYDLRRDWAIADYSFQDNNTNVKVLKLPADILTRDIGKWRREYEKVLPLSSDFGPTNFPVLRYADVLLMYAEADNEINNGPSPQAIEYVNQVRRRGYGKYLNGTGSVSESIKSLTIVNQGSGYTSPVTLSFKGSGAGALATATVTSGKITSVSLTNAGRMFSADPIVIINSSSGTGAEIKAIISPYSKADLEASQTASVTAFKEMIYDERARELAFEGIRNFDLKRWGIYLPVLQQTGIDLELNGGTAVLAYQGVPAFSRVESRHLLLPIPSADLALDKALVQNPGW